MMRFMLIDKTFDIYEALKEAEFLLNFLINNIDLF